MVIHPIICQDTSLNSTNLNITIGARGKSEDDQSQYDSSQGELEYLYKSSWQ